MDELYKRYGELMIQQEILQGQINEVKGKIAQGINEKVKEAQGKEVKAEA